MVLGEKAVFKYEVGAGTGWQEGDVIKIGGKDITIGANGDISLADMADPAKVAALVAKNLNGTVDGYTITANGSTLVYTAKKTGAVDPAAKPAGPAYSPGGILNAFAVPPRAPPSPPAPAPATFRSPPGTRPSA